MEESRPMVFLPDMMIMVAQEGGLAGAEVAFGRCWCTRPAGFRPDSSHHLGHRRPQTCSSGRHRARVATTFTGLLSPLAVTASIKSSY